MHVLRKARYGSRRRLLLQGVCPHGQTHVYGQQALRYIQLPFGLAFGPCLVDQALCSLPHDRDLSLYVPVLNIDSRLHVLPWRYQQELLRAHSRSNHKHPLPARQSQCCSPSALGPSRLSKEACYDPAPNIPTNPPPFIRCEKKREKTPQPHLPQNKRTRTPTVCQDSLESFFSAIVNRTLPFHPPNPL